jgi:flavin reductase (DIM6/NTAB) family NADH-FMN oxidoreductase RutF
MQFDMAQLAPRDRYKLLVSTVVPRPIALVTSLNETGDVNAAPFSFFNVLGSDPPLLALGIGDRNRDTPKDRRAQHPAQWRVRCPYRR